MWKFFQWNYPSYFQIWLSYFLWEKERRTSQGRGKRMIRQIDTSIGLVVGGVVGWFHHQWYTWSLLFGIMILWWYVEERLSEEEKEE